MNFRSLVVILSNVRSWYLAGVPLDLWKNKSNRVLLPVSNKQDHIFSVDINL